MDGPTEIISDIHLGSDACQSKLLAEYLADIDKRASRLILNGDIFEDMDFRRLKKSHWNILGLLRKLSKKMEVIWVVGNHDGSAEIVSHLLGIEVVDSYSFQSGIHNSLVHHGHQHDLFLDAHPWLTRIADVCYAWLQRLDKSHYLARAAKHSSKHYLRCLDIVRDGAVKSARKASCDVVCVGHTHHPTKEQVGDVLYVNSGSFCEIPCHYIRIEGDEVELKELLPQTKV